MAVTLTSEAYGKQPGETYSGPEEDWLLAQGYAKRAGYTGPGVSNTGVSDVVPAKDVVNPDNREDVPVGTWHTDAGPLDPAMILPGDEGYEDEDENVLNPEREGSMAPAYDFDPGGVNDDPVEPNVTPTA